MKNMLYFRFVYTRGNIGQIFFPGLEENSKYLELTLHVLRMDKTNHNEIQKKIINLLSL